MQNRRFYRIILAVASFVFAGLNAYKIIKGQYETMDVVLMVVFLVIGIAYLFILFRKNRPE